MSAQIEELAAMIADKLRPAPAGPADLWTIQMVADHLKCSYDQAGRYLARTDAPKAIRLPTGKGRGTPRYEAADVIAWARTFKDVN